MVADLQLAARVLVEGGVVHRHHDEAELDREAVMLVVELRSLEPSSGMMLDIAKS